MNNLFFHYLIILVVLFAGMAVYFRIARHYHIIDKPNERSSHNYITIRGGGIVFWLAGILVALMNLPESFYFMAGLTLLCGVSFWDDISSLSGKVRIVAHFLSISLAFYGLGLYLIFPIWMIAIAYVLFIGVLNAFNFMDGINGITGCYSLIILTCLQYVNYQVVSFTAPDFINYAILACLVFLFFNFRKRAKCFAGDVGSMAVAFWIVFLLLQLMMATGSFVWILFLSVYGVDSVVTILHRIYLKQNIFEAHRLHFYQILSNEYRMSHLKVSVLYATIQLMVCVAVIYVYKTQLMDFAWLFVLSLFPLFIIYSLKFRLMKSALKNIENNNPGSSSNLKTRNHA